MRKTDSRLLKLETRASVKNKHDYILVFPPRADGVVGCGLVHKDKPVIMQCVWGGYDGFVTIGGEWVETDPAEFTVKDTGGVATVHHANGAELYSIRHDGQPLPWERGYTAPR